MLGTAAASVKGGGDGKHKNLPQKMLHLPRPKGPRTAREALSTNTCVDPLRLRGCCRRRHRRRPPRKSSETIRATRRTYICNPTCKNPGSVGSVGLGLSVGSVCWVGSVLPARAQGMDVNVAGFFVGFWVWGRCVSIVFLWATCSKRSPKKVLPCRPLPEGKGRTGFIKYANRCFSEPVST